MSRNCDWLHSVLSMALNESVHGTNASRGLDDKRHSYLFPLQLWGNSMRENEMKNVLSLKYHK